MLSFRPDVNLMSAADEGVTMALVGRADLALSKGKFAAQAAHAAVAAALTCQKVSPRLLQKWLSSGARKVTLQASNLDNLKRIYGMARSDGLVAEMITDAGHTEIPAGTVTVVAIGPAPRNDVDAIIGSLPLLK